MNKTVVVFRKLKDSGDIVALFPFEKADDLGNIGSYMHVGQHSAADYNHVMKASVAATVEELSSLKAELESLGYDLKVMKRYRPGKTDNVQVTESDLVEAV